MALENPSDESLLALVRREQDGTAFAEFYERYFDVVLAYFARRTSSADVAADLTMETFAGALVSAQVGRSTLPDRAAPWLFGIARNVLADSYRAGQADSTMRSRLALQPLHLNDEDLQRIDELTEETHVLALLQALAPDQRTAVHAYVIEDRSHEQIARDLGTSAFVIRKRVSRGLAVLREALGGQR
ncbi:RNA polymerase sigma factor [Paraconexibacter sp. AEG42_29]|uniref:RNA polymerase sigma factor n=1 Tax=Paraconexibacter sp. AEG42_29 TaxID=2997339 RepID=A0AAU7AWU8_9ACTN